MLMKLIEKINILRVPKKQFKYECSFACYVILSLFLLSVLVGSIVMINFVSFYPEFKISMSASTLLKVNIDITKAILIDCVLFFSFLLSYFYNEIDDFLHLFIDNMKRIINYLLQPVFMIGKYLSKCYEFILNKFCRKIN